MTGRAVSLSSCLLCSQQRPCFPEAGVATIMAAVPVYSITRAEIDEFWRRKEVEAEERRLAAEKEAARIMAKTLKVSPCSWPTNCIFALSINTAYLLDFSIMSNMLEKS